MYKDLLKKIHLFCALEDDELEMIRSISIFKKLQKDEILFYEGESAEAFYILLEGELKLYKTTSKANEVVLHHFVEPIMVAEMATIEQIPFPATASAQKDETLVAIIQTQKFLALLEKIPSLSWHIIKSLTLKIKTIEKLVQRDMVLDAQAKVCSLLQEDPKIFENHKKADIANLLHMTPQTLSRTIRKLKDLKVLDQHSKVYDTKKLQELLKD